MEIIKSLLRNCGFDSLKNFVMEILSNDDVDIEEKIKEVTLMLISLVRFVVIQDTILVSSLEREVEQVEKAKPKPPFLPLREKPVKYTLVYDDIGVKVAELELLTYWSTYLYSRCNRSVSYATPAYYAYWAAKRGKAYITAAGQKARWLLLPH